MENYEHIWYLDCPHFTVGHVDQWSERGYLLFESKVYFYEVDRKDQCHTARLPVTIKEFLAYAEENQIAIPEDFLKEMMKDE